MAASALACGLVACRSSQPAPSQRISKQEAPSAASAKTLPPPTSTDAERASPVTHVEMHNVIVHEDSSFKLQIRWLRGEILPARRGVIPSFDDKSSLLFQIEAGVISADARDLTNLLNQKVFAYHGSPLSNVTLGTQGNQVKLSGTLHKGVPIPIQMIADLSATDQGRVRVHPTKLSALHIPVKAILSGLGIHVSDLIDPKGAKGVTVEGNDVILDLEKMMPAPDQRGRISAVHVRGNNIVEIFGSPRAEVTNARKWKNFIACEGGTLRFGKLTMHNADLTMIDSSPDSWFDFFLDHYQDQLREGYIKLNASGGLQVFMPDYGRLGTHAPAAQTTKENR